MIYDFDTDDRAAATAALLVYVVWRSRDTARYKITPEVWGQVQRFVESAAKRARTPWEFLGRLKPHLACSALAPRAMQVAVAGLVITAQTSAGEIVQLEDPDGRQFLTSVLAQVSDRDLLAKLRRPCSDEVICLVRDRLERERPIESRFVTALGAEVAS